MDIIDVEDRHRETETHFGREYQTYSLVHQINLSPIDEQEASIQKRQHLLLKDLWNDWPEHRLFPALIGDPQHILDCGFGTGVWSLEVTTQRPMVTVRGIDITPHLAPTERPPNLFLQISNLNEKTSFGDNTFDFVHSRFIAGGIGRFRWPNYLSDIYRILRVGGWIQIMEWELGFRSNNGQEDSLTALQEWVSWYNLSLGATGYSEGKKSTSVAQDCGAWLRTALFERVQTAFKEVPTCGWPTDTRWRRIGDSNLVIMRDLIDSLGEYPIVTRGIASSEEYKKVSAQAKQELARADAEPFIRLFACWGRKDPASD